MRSLQRDIDKMSTFNQRNAGIFLLALLSLTRLAVAADPTSTQETNPAILGSFTRAIQPLLLNRCAAGSCHGGPQGVEPKLLRGPIHGQANQKTTLRNLRSITTSVQHKSSDLNFLSKILNHHDKRTKRSATNSPLLRTHEQKLFATWLTLLPHYSKTPPQPAIPSPQSQSVNQASFEQPQQQLMSPYRTNRFKLLLEREANPPQFPPPQDTPGLRLKEILPNEFPLLEQTLSKTNTQPNKHSASSGE